MQPQTILLALAGTAAANLVPLPADAVKHAIKARQTDLDSANACMDAMNSFLTEMPTAGPDFVDWAASQTETDACKVTVPASLSSVLSSYQSAASSFWAANSAAFNKAVSACPGDIATMTDSFTVPTCEAGGSSSGGNGGGSSNSNNNNNNNNNNNGGENAANRQTGLAGAAVALAGFLGVVALL
jgi:hypothetical protein